MGKAKVPQLYGTERMSQKRLASALGYVRSKVISLDMVDAIHFVHGEKIVLDLESGVQRTLPWPG